MKSFSKSALGSMLVTVLAVASTARSEDFRIETATFLGQQKPPISQNKTLFRAGVVYDYLLSDPQSVAVFDQAHGRFILLDPVRRIKTEVKTDDVVAFSEKLQNLAAEGKNNFLKFTAKPEFQSEFDEEADQLTLTSEYMVYQVKTVKAHSPEAAKQYREFSDWYARLNAMTSPGSNPPFPRLTLNEHLARRDLLAERVELTIPKQSRLGGKPVSLRTEHKISWRLLPRDLDKIAETANHLTAFKTVSFAEFRSVAVSKR